MFRARSKPTSLAYLFAPLLAACNLGAFDEHPTAADAGALRATDAGTPVAPAQPSQGGAAQPQAGAGGAAPSAGRASPAAGSGGQCPPVLEEDAGMAPPAAPACPPIPSGGRPVRIAGKLDVLEDVPMPADWSLRLPGPAARIGGKSLWVFPKGTRPGVSIEPQQAGNLPTAALFGSAGPLQLDQMLSAEAQPRDFVTLKGDARGELWPSALLPLTAAGRPSALAFLRQFDLSSAMPLEVQAVWLATVDEGKTSAELNSAPLFSGTDPRFSTGLVRKDGYVYLYACATDMNADVLALERWACRVARAPIELAAQRSSYETFAGDGAWTRELDRGVPVLHGAISLSVAFNAHLGKYLAVHSRSLASRMVLQTAPSPEGPWGDVQEVELPAPEAGWITELQELTELREDCERRLTLTYFWPREVDAMTGAAVRGTTRLATIELE